MFHYIVCLLWSSRIVDPGLMTSLMTSSRIIIIDTKRATSQTRLPVSFTEVLLSFKRCALLRYLRRLILAGEPCRLPACPHKTYLARKSLGYTFLPLTVWVYLHANFSGWLRNTCVYCNGVHNWVHNCRPRSFQGQPRSLILVPIESAYSISY